MSFSGGTFSLASGNPVTTGTTISSTWANNTLSDIATGLSTCVLKDGTQTITANIPMSSFKFTGLAAGSAAGDSLRYEQVFTTGAVSLLGSVNIAGSASVSGSMALGTTLFVASTASVSGALNLAQGATLTATATVAIGAMTGNYAVITGTATVSSFDSLRAGAVRIIEWSGATPIEHNSNIILPNATKIVTQAGQVSTFISEGSAVWRMISHQPKTNPTRQVFVSGSGTYTLPTGCIYINVRLVGGGGGGAGGGTGTPGAGGTGGNTTFSTMTGSGGVGANAGPSEGGAGGAASGGDVNIPGGAGGTAGQGSGSFAGVGGGGGNSVFGGGGGGTYSGTSAGTAGATNSGGGGGGGGANVTGQASAGGGGAGGYCEKRITSPSATYSYVVGSGGSAGSAGTNGGAGGAGAAGIIIVDEYY